MDAKSGDSARKRIDSENSKPAGFGETSLKPSARGENLPGGDFNRRPSNCDSGNGANPASGYSVCIQFLPEAGQAVREKVWFEGQRVVVLEDRSVELSFEVTSLDGLDRWVLGWGSAAVVMKPRTLRANIVAAAQAIFEMHSD